MMPRPLNVLFVCEKNSTRSIMAEALLNRFGEDRFRAFNADIEPGSGIQPLTFEILQSVGFPTADLKSHLIQEFMMPGAPTMDFVICLGPKSMISALGGLPGKPMLAFWNISDPAPPRHELGAQRLALRRAFRELENRVRLFALLRFDRQGTGESSQQLQSA